MIFKRLRALCKNKCGFTFIEVMVAMVITGLIGGGVATVTYQVLSANAGNDAHMKAVTQVENAVHYITRDVQMAQVVNTTNPSGFPLTLNWLEWDNTTRSVTYAIQDGQLERTMSVNGGSPDTAIIAANINPDTALTNCSYAGRVLNFKLTVSVGGMQPKDETRAFQIVPRCN